MFFDIIKTIIIGIIEGITEWLPVSSTGHIILADEFLKINQSEAFMEMFEVVIQLGAIMAVVLLYFNKLNPFALKKTATEKKDTWTMWFKVLVAVLPAAVIGLAFDDFLDEHLYNAWVVAAMLIVYGIAFLFIEDKNKASRINSIDALDYKTALIIGAFQVLALIPGTSRSGATIIGATLLGTSRAVAAEFSFFLAIPVMLGASLLKIVKFGFDFTGGQIAILLTGCVVSFAVSILAVKFLMEYIKKNSFKVFGWYRIALGIVVLGYFMLKGIM